MAVKGVKDRFWEMRTGGPYSDKPGQDPSTEIFKCTDCGAETIPEKGFGGEPDKHLCSRDCRREHGDWSHGGGNKTVFRRNFDRIFPNAPGAGL